MKHLRKITAMAVCAAIAGSMTAGAACLSNNGQPTTSTTYHGIFSASGNLSAESFQKFWESICDSNLPENDDASTPMPPNITPDMPNQTPAYSPDADETPDTPDDTTPPEEDTNDTANASYAAQVVQLVNAERAKQGLPALTIHTGAQAAAQVRAQEQAQSFSHTRPNGTSCFTALTEQGVTYRSAGENIAYGQKTPQEVVSAWMNSAGHRANILSETFTEIGVGYAVVNGQSYWAQLFIS